MVSKIHLLVFLSTILAGQLLAQNGKLSWYYPKLGEVNAEGGLYGASGCVSGNCKSGTGEYLIALPSYDSKMGFMEVNPVMKLTLFKGEFSNEGKNFTGKVYRKKVYYDVAYKKNEPRLVPKVKDDLRDINYWKTFEIASGSMQHNGFVYRWSGWMEPIANLDTSISAGAPSTIKLHITDAVKHAQIQYVPGGIYNEIAGMMLPGGDLLAGRFRFSDGTMYEGFVHNGSRFGPGRYILNNGTVEEGIWMRDSLAISTPVSLPSELFEPLKEQLPSLGKIPFGGYDWPQFRDAGKGWVYAFYENDLYFGKLEGGKLTGPGIQFSRGSSPNYEVGIEWNTFRTGIFKDGIFQSGMKITDVMEVTGNKSLNSMEVPQYVLNRSTVTIGEFSGDQLAASCGKRIRYDRNGNPVELIEGYFIPGQFKMEKADGWVYLNDWEGKRDAVNLRYMHNDYDYLTMDGKPGYVTWFTRGMDDVKSAKHCFPSISSQQGPIIQMMKHRADSVVAIVNKREEEILALKKMWEKTGVEGQTEASKYNYKVGELYELGGAAYPVRVLITGYYQAFGKSFPVIMQNWFQSTANTGYMTTANNYISVVRLKDGKKISDAAAVCDMCMGRATMPHTLYTRAGDGQEPLWGVKNPHTYWKSNIMVQCTQCKGIGFVRKR